MMKYVFIFQFLLCFALHAVEENWLISAGGMEVPFYVWHADGENANAPKADAVLVLVPGYNGDGAAMFDERWKNFAKKNRLILLAPTFHANDNEVHKGKSYHYPEQGSGEVMEKALEKIHERSGINVDQVLLFGFSAGAHFSHRFAMWKPARVKAFVAYSAAWWSTPTEKLTKIPALIMCGETDERYAASFAFFKQGHQLGCPWIWRSYNDTNHELTPAVRNMAEAFLADQVKNSTKKKDEHWVGDFQTFKKVRQADHEMITEEFRIQLPSTEVANVWEKETE
jgi:predicted esterase